MTEEMSRQMVDTIRLAREGDAGAFDALLVQYTPLIENRIADARAKSQNILPEDEKDLRQEACIAFYRALLNYDMEQSEVSFGLYAKICIGNALVSALRKMHPSAQVLDMEALETLPADEEGDPTRRLREREDYEALCRVIARTLSPYENNIWQRYIAGATVAEIAAALGRESRSIHNAIYRIRHKLRSTDGVGKRD